MSKPGSISIWRAYFLAACLLSFFLPRTSAQIAHAEIIDVFADGADLVVRASVPSGHKKITLESRPRLDRQTWEPRAIKRTDPAGGVVEFRIQYSDQLEVLRVKAEATDNLPDIFFQGETAFNASANPFSGTTGTTSGTTGATSAGSTGATTSGTTSGTDGTSGGVTTGNTTGGEPRDVVESDIWKVAGNRIYFFNQVRGLQIIDITNPAAPALKGSLSLPAAGEQMYLLPGNRVALLARRTACSDAPGRVLIVNVSNDQPVISQEFVLKGQIAESRLVGSVLYVAANEFRLGSESRWEEGTALRSFNFAGSAITTNELWISRPTKVVQSTDQYFLLYQQYAEAQTNALIASTLTLLHNTGGFSGARDVYQLVGNQFTLTQEGVILGSGTFTMTLPNNGTVRFQTQFTNPALMQGDSDDIALVSSSPGSNFGSFNGQFISQGTSTPMEGSYFFDNSPATHQIQKREVQYVDISAPDGSMVHRGVVPLTGSVADKFKLHAANNVLYVISAESNGNSVKTFSMTGPNASAPLDTLNFAPSEQLFATRFHEDKVFVVTFLRTDPLWVIDLANPADLKISGELIIPGWSTYIQPLPEGRLLTVGIGDNFGQRLAVQLFDVSNPATPKLLDKEWLGQSWSNGEVTRDEKAFGYFPAENLILVPFEENNSNVQLLDLIGTNLVLRGKINHTFTARRATISQNHVISISAKELLSFDVTNRDLPIEKSTVPLVSPAHQVFVMGEHVITLERDPYRATPATSLRLASTNALDVTLETLPLDAWRFGGAIQAGNALYLAQYRPKEDLEGSWPIYFAYTNGQTLLVTNPPTFRTIEITIEGSRLKTNVVTASVPPLQWVEKLSATFISSNLLVWRNGDPSGGNWGGTTGTTAGGTTGTSSGTTAGGTTGLSGGSTGGTTSGATDGSTGGSPGTTSGMMTGFAQSAATTGSTGGSSSGTTGGIVHGPWNLINTLFRVNLATGPNAGKSLAIVFGTSGFYITNDVTGNGTYTYSWDGQKGNLQLNYAQPEGQVDSFTLTYTGSDSGILQGATTLPGQTPQNVSGAFTWSSHWLYESDGSRLLAFQVAPSLEFKSDTKLPISRYQPQSKLLGTNNLALFSAVREYQEIVGTNNSSPTWAWRFSVELHVVDYSDSTQPLLRRPVDLPGALVAIDLGGQVLYTSGPRVDTNGFFSSHSVVSALAYDGADAYLLDSVETIWPDAEMFHIANNRVYFPDGYYNGSSLKGYELDPNGKLQLSLDSGLSSTTFQAWIDSSTVLGRQGENLNLYSVFPEFKLLGTAEGFGCIPLNASEIKGGPDDTIYMPAGNYGVIRARIDRLPSP